MILLHLIVVWMVYRVANLLTGNHWTALFAMATFGLMPQQAQVVIWSTVTDLPMNAAFELAAFEFYLRSRSSPASDPIRRKDILLSLAFFVCALGSYDSAITFPLLIAVYAILFPAVKNPSPAAVRTLAARIGAVLLEVWPYLIVITAYLAVRIVVLGSITPSFPHNAMTAREMALTIPSAFWGYAMLLVMPWRAFPAAHNLEIVNSIAASGFILPVAGLIGISGMAIVAFRRHPHRRLYLFCAAWVLIALAPALDLRGLRADLTIADRYLYFPAFGFCVMFADWAVSLADAGKVRVEWVQIGSVVVVVILGAMLFHDEQYWRDDLALYSHAVEEFPEVGIWHTRLGLILASKGDFQGARRELESGTTTDPDTDGNALYALGLVYEELGDRALAEKAMVKGLSRFDHPPLVAYTELAIAADAAGDSIRADKTLSALIEQPGGPEAAALTRAKLLFIHGDANGSEKTLRELLKLDPNYTPALIFLGTALSSGDRYAEALDEFRRASSLAPYDPDLHYQVALMLHQLGRDPEARAECKIALAQAPDDKRAHALMAAIQGPAGKL
ncbi:MAG TPA: tetratricopeptide repeat protein, partial [Candidatus Binataceae bacterium]|nr:tetratricopeptide repeat protein [Candidatus Binataceae bacterium]